MREKYDKYADGVPLESVNWYNTGNEFAHHESIKEAMSAYRRSIAICPTFALPHLNLGQILGRIGKIDEAIQELENAVKLAPDLAETRGNLGRAYHSKGRFDDEIKEYLTVLQMDDSIPEIHFNLGGCYGDKGDFSKAILHYQRAIELRPNYEDAQLNLRIVKKRLQGKQQSKHNISAEEWIELSEHHAKSDSWDKVETCLINALKIEPKNVRARYYRGLMYYKTQRFTEAEEELQLAMEIDRKYPGILATYGLVLKNMLKIKEAKLILAEANQINQSDWRAYYNLANILYDEGKFDDAIENYEKSVEINENFEGGWLNMGNAYNKKGNKEQAKRCYYKVLKINPNSIFAINILRSMR